LHGKRIGPPQFIDDSEVAPQSIEETNGSEDHFRRRLAAADLAAVQRIMRHADSRITMEFYGMPRAVAEAGLSTEEVTLQEMTDAILRNI